MTTVNVARIGTSNTAYNRVPDDATAHLDIRFPAGKEPEGILAHLREMTGGRVEVLVDALAPPHHADPDRAEVRFLRRYGDLLRKHGSADGRFYSARGVNAAIFGPGGDGQHGPDEYADLTTVEPYHRAVTDLLHDVGR